LHDVLKRLSTEHVELEQALAGIRPRQFRTEEGRSRLFRVHDLFLAHIHEEESDFYPVLEKAATADARIAEHLRRMSDDLKIVAGLAEEFFRKYQQGEPKLIEFATDHGALLTILKIRLKREEQTLFPLFESLSRN
jgi:hemerythrin-like domain-containing protein